MFNGIITLPPSQTSQEADCSPFKQPGFLLQFSLLIVRPERGDLYRLNVLISDADYRRQGLLGFLSPGTKQAAHIEVLILRLIESVRPGFSFTPTSVSVWFQNRQGAVPDVGCLQPGCLSFNSPGVPPRGCIEVLSHPELQGAYALL